MKEGTPSISKGAVIRAIVLVVFLINAIFAMFGFQAIPIGEADVEVAVNAVYAAISAIGIIVAAGIAYWKDNDITAKARNWKKYLSKK